MKEAFGAVHRVRIDQILHKWIFRFQQCLEQLPIKFPDQQMLKKFTINETLPPQQGFREFLGFLEVMHNHSADLFSLFRTNPAMPLHLLATGIGKPLFSAMAQVAATKETYLRCCTGSSDELAIAEAALSSTTTIVLEPTAIWNNVFVRCPFRHSDLRRYRQMAMEMRGL